MADISSVAAKLSNVLPTGTFLVFHALAPLTTNNGHCGVFQKVLTGFMLFVLSLLCGLSCFTDSHIDPTTNTLYPGWVESTGLRNAALAALARAQAVQPAQAVQGQNVQPANVYRGNGEYNRRKRDFVNAGISVAALATLTLLTAPVTTCFYPHIADSIVKTVPLLVGLLLSAIGTVTKVRNGFGFTRAN
jgi:hypothetical protein